MDEYRNEKLSLEERVEDLLARMTVQEKIGQMINIDGFDQYERRGDEIVLTEEFKKAFARLHIGSLNAFCRADWWSCRDWDSGIPPKLLAKSANLFQRHAIENSRLGIPLWLGIPTVHGLMVLGGTVPPSVTGMGGAWNSEIVERIYDVAAKEASSARLCRGCLSLDIARDPRWSRIEECFGEDPYLVSALGVASTIGLQGRDFPREKGKVVAIMRHFGGHGDPEGGHNAGAAHLGPIEAHNIQFRPFREAVKAGARGLMSSYNTIDCVPSTGSRTLLTDILRTQWGFKGYVVSDGGAIEKLHGDGFSETVEEAYALAVRAGVDKDINRNPDLMADGMKTSLEKGWLSIEDVNEAVRRLLRAKFEMGLFENPYAEENAPVEILGCEKHREVVLEAARETLTLLSNPNGMLPLAKKIKRLAVIGPNADAPENQLGDYTAPQRREDIVTVLDGMKKMASREEIELSYARGCKIRSSDKSGFEEALKAANGSDAIILVLGGSSAPGREVDYLPTGAARANEMKLNSEIDKESGEGYDRSSLRLAGVQLDLLRELKRTGKPIATVLIMGRPLIIEEVLNLSDAVLLAWYPGMMGGQAIAEALFGDVNPGGKLPVSFPRDEGQLPVYYNFHRPRPNYIDLPSAPLLPFGFGLSYTKFEFSELSLDKAIAKVGSSVKASVKVKNVGDKAGDEVAQLYLSDKVSSVARPCRELRGFKRVRLEPGETKTVEFHLGDDEFGLYNQKLDYVVEPGDFTIAVGGGLDSLLETNLRIEQ